MQGGRITPLGFDVYGDLDERVKAYAEVGIEVMMSGRGPGRAFAYLDTEKIGGVILELLQREGPGKWLKLPWPLNDSE